MIFANLLTPHLEIWRIKEGRVEDPVPRNNMEVTKRIRDR